MGTIWFANETGAVDAPAPQGEDADPEGPELDPLELPALLPLKVPDVAPLTEPAPTPIVAPEPRLPEGTPAVAPLIAPEPTTVLVPELAPPPGSERPARPPQAAIASETNARGNRRPGPPANDPNTRALSHRRRLPGYRSASRERALHLLAAFGGNMPRRRAARDVQCGFPFRRVPTRSAPACLAVTCVSERSLNDATI